MRFELVGVIGAAGFASGDRVVIGRWSSSPVGPMVDVMWAAPDGTRTLFAPRPEVAELITAVYDFDEVEVVSITSLGSDDARIEVAFADREVRLVGGRARSIPFPWRPAWVTRLIEAPVARLAMGVRTYGVSSRGVREWYRSDRWRPVQEARAAVAGIDLGPLAPVDPPCRFGFSEPPRRPSITSVRPLLEDPSGALDGVLDSLRTAGPGDGRGDD